VTSLTSAVAREIRPPLPPSQRSAWADATEDCLLLPAASTRNTPGLKVAPGLDAPGPGEEAHGSEPA